MGDNEIIQIRAKAHRAVLRARAFERLVNSDLFEDTYTGSDAVKKILKSGDPDDLKIWLEANRGKSLYTMSYRQLRDLAKEHNIPKWSRLDTYELLSELEQIPAVKERYNATDVRTG